MTLRTALGTLTLCGVLVASGCGGDPEPAPRPSPSGSSSGSDTSSSPSPSGPTAQPATGPAISTTNATVNAPAGWTKPYGLNQDDFKNYTDKTGLSSVTIADMGQVGSTADPEVELKKTALQGNGKQAASAPTDTDSTLGGELAAHASYDEKLFHTEVYGAFHDGVFVWVSWAFFTKIPPAEQQKIVEEGLASFQWK